MPGFIDAHRHIAQGDPAEWLAKRAAPQMQEFLDAGFTTVLCAICPDQAIELRQRIESGAVKGPRLYLGSIIPLARAGAPGPAGAGRGGGRGGDPARFDKSRPPCVRRSPQPAFPRPRRSRPSRQWRASRYDYIKTVITTTPGGPETDTLKLIVAEGKKHNLPTITHAVWVIDTLAAVEAGPDVLVHTPHIGRLEDDAAAVKKIAGAGIPMTSTLAVFVPHFVARQHAAVPRCEPFPWKTISSAGQGPVNARLLWEAGISYGYGTDTSWPPKESLADELRALQPRVLAARHQQDHRAGRRAFDAQTGSDRDARAGQAGRHRAHRRQSAYRHQRSAEGRGDDQGRADCFRYTEVETTPNLQLPTPNYLVAWELGIGSWELTTLRRVLLYTAPAACPTRSRRRPCCRSADRWPAAGMSGTHHPCCAIE